MPRDITRQVVNMFCMPYGSGVLCIGGWLPVISSTWYTYHTEACAGPFSRQLLVYVMIPPLSSTAGEHMFSRAYVPKLCHEAAKTENVDPCDCNAKKHSVRSVETFGLECIS